MAEQLDSTGRTALTPSVRDRHQVAEATACQLEDLPPLPTPQPLGTRAWRWLRTGRVPAAVLLTVAAVSAGLAAVGAHVVDGYQQTWAQNATVSLLAEVPAAGDGQGGGTADGVALDGTIQFINTGPAIVRVLDVQASQSGVAISYLNGPTSIAAGHALQVNVHVTMACMAYVLQEPITLQVTARAADGHQELVQVPLDIRSGSWADLQFHACRW